MAVQEDQFKKVLSHAKEYGFVFQSSEIYDGLSAVYDYAQHGVELKKNIREYWWKAMVQLHDNIVGVDAAILMHPTTWKASGHVDAFNDPLIDNKDSKKRYRADVLIEDYCAKIEGKINKEVTKAAKRFGDAFDKDQFVATNPRVLGYQEKINSILSRMAKSLENEDLADVKLLIEELGIVDPLTGSKNWTEVKQFNLMFGTQIGASAENSTQVYLRPETAQGIFVNFLNVQKTGRMKIPFGIAQTGKAFRNEIVARQFIFRMREFEQMEMQFFIKPGTQKEWYGPMLPQGFAQSCAGAFRDRAVLGLCQKTGARSAKISAIAPNVLNGSTHRGQKAPLAIPPRHASHPSTLPVNPTGHTGPSAGPDRVRYPTGATPDL